MTSEGLGEMFEGDFTDTCAGKFLLALIGGRAEGLACADLEVRTPISASVNLCFLLTLTTIVQNPRRGCRRVPKFCKGSY